MTARKPPPRAPEPPAQASPPRLSRLAGRVSAATAEILLAVVTFVIGLTLVLGVPGVSPAIFWLLDFLLGRPMLAPDKVQQVHSIVLTPLAILVAAALYGWLGRRIDHGDAPPPLPWRPPAGLGALVGEVALGILVAIAGSYILALVMQALGAPVSEQRLVLELTASGDLRRPELATLVLSALVLAPVGEELFFRRLLLRRTWQRGGAVAGYLASALLFAAFHGNLQGFVVYAWLGLVFARTYARTGRIGAAIAVHFGNNAITLAMLVLADRA